MKNGIRQGRLQIGLLVLVLAAGLGAGAFFLWRGALARANEKEPGEESGDSLGLAISAKTIRPRMDKALQMTVDRPADVEAYYRVDVEARLAGEVRSIRVAPGSRVKKYRTLVSLYVPDLEATEREKGNIVQQRQRELLLDKAKTEAAQAAVKTALANVEEKKTLLRQAKATTKLREQQFERLDGLWRSGSVDKNVRDEAARNLEVARAGEVSADAARIKAEAETEDARANVKVMEAETDRCKQLIEVARSDHEKAKAIVEYATVKAPFPGTVINRKVNPGSFVQNASTGNPTPVLTLERTDIVTVVMRVPDNYAPFVTPGTEAIIELDSLPGIKIRGQVTRFAPSLVTASRDRTMRVEVDLWNKSAVSYKKFISDPRNLTDLKEGPLPLVPELTGSDSLQRSTRLMAGMYGKMTLLLKTFTNVRLIPSQAILRQGGRTYVYVVEHGKARRMPVVVILDDGNLAKVERLAKDGRVLGDLTGEEEVVVSNQEELSEGQQVAPTPLEDWSELQPKKTEH
jgi:HlyD family secretion protein